MTLVRAPAHELAGRDSLQPVSTAVMKIMLSA